MAWLVEARDAYTAGHLWRVGEYARLIACRSGCSDTEVAQVTLAATVHDLGKVAIPSDVLVKPGPLTTEELEVVRRHPRIGYWLLDALE
jgi:HD-GYP domain-containing protein (c-di-GMP phosphodiesterase class II)